MQRMWWVLNAEGACVALNKVTFRVIPGDGSLLCGCKRCLWLQGLEVGPDGQIWPHSNLGESEIERKKEEVAWFSQRRASQDRDARMRDQWVSDEKELARKKGRR